MELEAESDSCGDMTSVTSDSATGDISSCSTPKVKVGGGSSNRRRRLASSRSSIGDDAGVVTTLQMGQGQSQMDVDALTSPTSPRTTESFTVSQVTGC